MYIKIKEESVLKPQTSRTYETYHGYLMTKEETPICEVYGIRLTVKHIITKCLKQELDGHRIEMESFNTSLRLETVHNTRIINMYKKIKTNIYNT